MNPGRDRLLAAAAAGVVIVLAVGVISLLNDVQDRGRRALERERTQQVEQIAANLDSRIESVFEFLTGFAAAPYTLAVGDPADLATIEQLALDPDATTGSLLVNDDVVVTNGVLLQDPAIVGTTLDRPDLEAALAAGDPAILPTAAGITTPNPAGLFFTPILSESGAVRGALLLEFEVAADSAFNEEVGRLRSGDTGLFMVLDSAGNVVASSDPALLASAAEPALAGAPAGLTRDEGQITVSATIPSGPWRMVSTQSADEFEEGLGEQAQRAVLLMVLAAIVIGGAVFVTLLRRLRAAREEQRRLKAQTEKQSEFY